MRPPPTPSKRSRDGKKKPKSPHLSKFERRKEKNTRKSIIKKETAKHLSRAKRREEKNAHKAVEKKARKAAKKDARKLQQAGAADDRVVHVPSIFNFTPETAKVVAKAAQDSSPSEYTIHLGTPIFPSPGQGGDEARKLERSLAADFLQVRETIEGGRGARASSPIIINDDSEGEDSETEFASQPPQATIHHNEYLVFFDNENKERKPNLMTPDSNNEVKSAPIRRNYVTIPDDPRRIAFNANGRELRAVGYFNINSDNEVVVEDTYEYDPIDLDIFADELAPEDITINMSDDEDEESSYRVLDLSDGEQAEDEGDSDTDEVDWRDAPLTPAVLIDLTQDENSVDEIDNEHNDIEEVDEPARASPPSSRIDITQDDDAMDETEDEDDAPTL
jgi:hypothetical protein